MLNKCLTLGAFLILALLSYYPILVQHTQPTSYTSSHATAPIVFKEITIYQFDKEGLLAHQLKAKSLTQYSQKNQQLLYEPVIKVVRNDSNWLIKAEQGRVESRFEKITLLKNVSITQYQEHTRISKLLTQQLNYFPIQDELFTKTPITFLKQGVLLKANTLHANLKQGRFKLSGKATGVYDPQTT